MRLGLRDRALDGTLTPSADDVVWHASGNNPYSGELVGKEASLARMGQLAQDGVTISFDIHDVVANDEHVWC